MISSYTLRNYADPIAARPPAFTVRNEKEIASTRFFPHQGCCTVIHSLIILGRIVGYLTPITKKDGEQRFVADSRLIYVNGFGARVTSLSPIESKLLPIRAAKEPSSNGEIARMADGVRPKQLPKVNCDRLEF
ncbi:hypothetical protein GWI33_016339 [Rhynchophorus ferrugineus]|uniref:Uncharacterized protein n=1 Tax=Rhynchophorus ferrugineus TaxID=354439 RepID=A0A834M3F5_RHYFE|nr:hypothetical protein GWI33_016339 [Rhynchophorus ferrugineus]